MAKQRKTELAERVILAARQYSISNVLFRNRVCENLGVHVTDMECLGLILFQGMTTPSELSRHTGLSSGATTAMLDRLEGSGLVERCPNPDDRRGTLVALTQAGTEKVASRFRSVRRAHLRLTMSYSESELRIISDYLEKSTDMWEQERQKIQKKQ